MTIKEKKDVQDWILLIKQRENIFVRVLPERNKMKVVCFDVDRADIDFISIVTKITIHILITIYLHKISYFDSVFS